MAWFPCGCGAQTCCPGFTWPDTLNWLLTTSGTCTCGWNGLTGTVTKTDPPPFGEVYYSGQVSGCADGVIITRPVIISCVGGSWNITFNYANSSYLFSTYACDGTIGAGAAAVVSAECDPLEIVFSGTVISYIGTCPCAGQTYTFTFTE